MSSRLVPVNDLVTVDDIAKRLKMSVNCVSNIVRGRDKKQKLKFPKPIVGTGTRAVWLWDEVEEWHGALELKAVKPARRPAKTYRQPSWSHRSRGAA